MIPARLAALALLLGAGPALAGPLDPPAGPVAPTMKTLQQVEPRIPLNAETCPPGVNWSYGIVKAGSYYLEGDLLCATGKRGIFIGASGVTIDLNGFAVVGTAGALTGVDGDLLEVSDVTIRNGAIRTFGGDGIKAATSASNWRIENVRIASCAGGIRAPRNTSVTGCVVTGCSGAGITATWGSTIENCAAYDCDSGFVASFGTTLANCTAQASLTHGFSLSGGSSATGCNATFNQTDGFVATEGARIANCVASRNQRDGIRLMTRSTATGNTCDENGPSAQGAGIRTTGGRNRVEGNALTGNYYAIRSEAANNCFVQNSASGNGYLLGYSFDGGSAYGPIVSGSGPMTTTSPWANIIH